MTKYEVWQIGGGYFQSFASWREATTLKEKLENEFPKSRFQIIEVVE